jgi:type II secretory pathway pseudopilin PulG
MTRPINPSSCRSASNAATGGHAAGAGNRGYALLIVMMVATLLLISLTVALPNVYRAGQREREEELIFRGNEYARAIMLFQRQFRRYPSSVKELLQTNNIRFLRREYRDPMSRKGKWRFIYANANGVVLNSKTIAPPKPPNPLGSMGGSATSAQQEASKAQGEEEAREPPSSFFSNEAKGGFIVGVASTSRKKSIRVWNGKTRYDEWEFLGLPGTATLGGVPAVGGQPPAAGQQTSPNQPGQQRSGMPGFAPPQDVPLTDQ